MLQNQSPFDPLNQQPIQSQPMTTDPLGRAGGMHAARFAHNSYLLRRKFLKLVGASFYVDDPTGNVVLYAELKAFKLKEDIRLFTGEDKTTEVLRIGARSILDFGATYDVFDSTTNQKLGALKRQGMKSMIRDEWTILDAQDREMGQIVEDSMVLALIRRFIEYTTYFLPQKYTMTVGSREVGTFSQTRNPLLIKMNANFVPGSEQVLDRRLAIAAGIMLCAIEGKQR